MPKKTRLRIVHVAVAGRRGGLFKGKDIIIEGPVESERTRLKKFESFRRLLASLGVDVRKHF